MSNARVTFQTQTQISREGCVLSLNAKVALFLQNTDLNEGRVSASKRKPVKLCVLALTQACEFRAPTPKQGPRPTWDTRFYCNIHQSIGSITSTLST